MHYRGQEMSHGGIPVCSECGAPFDLQSATTDGCAQTGLCYACLSLARERQQEHIAREMERLLARHQKGKQEGLFRDV